MQSIAWLLWPVLMVGVLSAAALVSNGGLRPGGAALTDGAGAASPIGALALRAAITSPYVDGGVVMDEDRLGGAVGRIVFNSSRVEECPADDLKVFALAISAMESMQRGALMRWWERSLYNLGILRDPTLGPIQMRVSRMREILAAEGVTGDEASLIIAGLENEPCDGLHLVLRYINSLKEEAPPGLSYDEFRTWLANGYVSHSPHLSPTTYSLMVLEIERILRSGFYGWTDDAGNYYKHAFTVLLVTEDDALITQDDGAAAHCASTDTLYYALRTTKPAGNLQRILQARRERAYEVLLIARLARLFPDAVATRKDMPFTSNVRNIGVFTALDGELSPESGFASTSFRAAVFCPLS